MLQRHRGEDGVAGVEPGMRLEEFEGGEGGGGGDVEDHAARWDPSRLPHRLEAVDAATRALVDELLQQIGGDRG